MKAQSIKDKLQDLVHETISELNPGAIDETLQEFVQDWDYILEAVEYLEEKLKEIKEGE